MHTVCVCVDNKYIDIDLYICMYVWIDRYLCISPSTTTSTSTSTSTSTCASSTSTRSSVGPGYKTTKAKVFDLDTMMGGLDGAEMLRTALRVAPNVRPNHSTSRTSTTIAGMSNCKTNTVFDLDTMMGEIDEQKFSGQRCGGLPM